MRENPDYSSYSYNCTGSIENSGIKIHCYNGHVHGQVNLQDSLAYSCNTSFSNIGLSLDPSKFKKTAEEVLFDSKLPSDLPYSKSSSHWMVQREWHEDDDGNGTGRDASESVS